MTTYEVMTELNWMMHLEFLMLSATKHLGMRNEILRFAQDDKRALRMTSEG